MESKIQGLSEDWLSLIIGLIVFALSLVLVAGVDVLGWIVTTSVWTDSSKTLAPVSKAFAGLGGVGALIATYFALLVLMTPAAVTLRADIGRFVVAFSALFLLRY